MTVYSVTPSGNVIRASKVVDRKLRELADAQERLILARLHDSMRAVSAPAPKPSPVAAPAKVVKKKNATRISIIRKRQLLNRWNQSGKTCPTYNSVTEFVYGLSKLSEFRWCADVSDYGIEALVIYLKNNCQ